MSLPGLLTKNQSTSDGPDTIKQVVKPLLPAILDSSLVEHISLSCWGFKDLFEYMIIPQERKRCTFGLDLQ